MRYNHYSILYDFIVKDINWNMCRVLSRIISIRSLIRWEEYTQTCVYWLINNSTLRLITYVNISFEPFDIDLSNALIIIAIGDILAFLCLIELFSRLKCTQIGMY